MREKPGTLPGFFIFVPHNWRVVRYFGSLGTITPPVFHSVASSLKSLASRPSPTPSSLAWATPPTASRSTARRCERSRPPSWKLRCRSWTRRAAQVRRQRKEPRNDYRIPQPARPRGSTGTSRARRYVRLWTVTPRRARVPPIDGLPPHLTKEENTEI